MTDPNFIILYVDSASASADFYTGLLGRTLDSEIAETRVSAGRERFFSGHM
jgi:hypothetical protein